MARMIGTFKAIWVFTMKFNFRIFSLVLVLVTVSFHITTMAFAGETKNTLVFDCDNPGDDAVNCVACNIYHEARSESHPGFWLVAFATKNRVDDRFYPAKKTKRARSGPGPKVKKEAFTSEFCQVVYEQRWDKKRTKWTPMFSWTRDGKHDRVYNKGDWLDALELSQKLIAWHEGTGDEEIIDFTFGCEWYHRYDISPYWMKQYHPTVRIGAHQCYTRNESTFLSKLGELVPQIGMMRIMALDSDSLVPDDRKLSVK